MTLVYDGSYCGYLTALSKGSASPVHVEDIITEAEASSILLGDLFYIRSDPAAAETLKQRVFSISGKAAYNIFCAYLSETPGCETAALRYLSSVMKHGRSADTRLADPEILTMIKLAQKVLGECHRMLGLLRFSETEKGIFYAPYEPDHNITSLIAGHFADRLPDRDWIIHDRCRGIAAVYMAENRRYEVVSGEITDEPEFTDDERRYRDLWKGFCRSIAICERKNAALQRRCMPARYWKHLTEKN